MRSTTAVYNVPKRIWQMPIVPESYDRRPLLSDEEREAVTQYVQNHAAIFARAHLARLEQLLMDVMHLRSHDKGRTCAVRKVMFGEMFRRETTFWVWSYEDWCAVLHPSSKLFIDQYPPGWGGKQWPKDGQNFYNGIGKGHECSPEQDRAFVRFSLTSRGFHAWFFSPNCTKSR